MREGGGAAFAVGLEVEGVEEGAPLAEGADGFAVPLALAGAGLAASPLALGEGAAALAVVVAGAFAVADEAALGVVGAAPAPSLGDGVPLACFALAGKGSLVIEGCFWPREGNLEGEDDGCAGFLAEPARTVEETDFTNFG